MRPPPKNEASLVHPRLASSWESHPTSSVSSERQWIHGVPSWRTQAKGISLISNLWLKKAKSSQVRWLYQVLEVVKSSPGTWLDTLLHMARSGSADRIAGKVCISTDQQEVWIWLSNCQPSAILFLTKVATWVDPLPFRRDYHTHTVILTTVLLFQTNNRVCNELHEWGMFKRHYKAWVN